MGKPIACMRTGFDMAPRIAMPKREATMRRRTMTVASSAANDA